jgi:DNA-directed RNA polymerase specialized sigma24 family protein
MKVVSNPLPKKKTGPISHDSAPDDLPKQKWVITAEAFEKFLAVLSSDSQEAGMQYEVLRIKCIRYFEWKSSSRPEHLADKTLDRVVQKIDQGTVITNIKAYVAGVARHVWQEEHDPFVSLEENLPSGLAVAPSQADDDDPDPQLICFDRCLEELSPENRKLLLAYFQEQGRDKIDNRIQLAENLGIPLNALRIRVFRIKKTLEGCIEKCLGVALKPK